MTPDQRAAFVKAMRPHLAGSDTDMIEAALDALLAHRFPCPECEGTGETKHDESCDLLAWGDLSPGGDYGPQGYLPPGGTVCDCGALPCPACPGTGVSAARFALVEQVGPQHVTGRLHSAPAVFVNGEWVPVFVELVVPDQEDTRPPADHSECDLPCDLPDEAHRA